MTALANSTIRSYFFDAVNEGRLKRHEILYSINEKNRNKFESYISKYQSPDIYKIKARLGLERESVDALELQLYFDFRDARIGLGEMYENIRFIETKLHSSIKNFLVDKFGENDNGWWRKGIPTKIRTELSKRFEEDDNPATHQYCYTNLIHLKDIIENNWNDLKSIIPKNISNDRKNLSKKLVELNKIRNYVMHPVKGIDPTLDDYQFVINLMKYLKLDKWY